MIYETVGIRFWLFVRNIHSKFYSFKIQRKIFIQRNYSFKILAQNIHSMFYSLKSGNIYSKLSKTKSAQIKLIEMLDLFYKQLSFRILAPIRRKWKNLGESESEQERESGRERERGTWCLDKNIQLYLVEGTRKGNQEQPFCLQSSRFSIYGICREGRENLNIHFRRKWFWVNSGSEKVRQVMLPWPLLLLN